MTKTNTPKAIMLRVGQREGFALYLHLRSAALFSKREEEWHDDLWTSFELDEIKARHESQALDFSDFVDGLDAGNDVTLSREEIGALVLFTTPTQNRPVSGQLAGYLRPLRKRWEAARDRAGLKDVSDTEEGAA